MGAFLCQKQFRYGLWPHWSLGLDERLVFDRAYHKLDALLFAPSIDPLLFLRRLSFLRSGWLALHLRSLVVVLTITLVTVASFALVLVLREIHIYFLLAHSECIPVVIFMSTNVIKRQGQIR